MHAVDGCSWFTLHFSLSLQVIFSCCFLNFIPPAPHLWLLYFSLPRSCYVSTRDNVAGFPPSAVWIKQFLLAGTTMVQAGSETVSFTFMCLFLCVMFTKSLESSLCSHLQITSHNTHQVCLKIHVKEFLCQAKSVCNLLNILSCNKRKFVWLASEFTSRITENSHC